jgi:hypothetical protein
MMISAGIISLLLKMELTIGDAFGAALATFRLSSHRSLRRCLPFLIKGIARFY